MDLFNTIIGFLALIISIIALAHSIYYNMVKLKLSDLSADKVDDGYDTLYSFSISNLSNISVVIERIELYSADGKVLKDNGFDPFKHHLEELDKQDEEAQSYGIFGSPFPLNTPALTNLDPNWESSPFRVSTEIYPASREEFSYYLDEAPTKIAITTNKRIYKFKKSQSFFVDFPQQNDMD